jgi:hypothetical protein
MRTVPRSLRGVALVLASTTMSLLFTAVVTAQEPAIGLAGTWKLVVLAFGTDEFAIIKIDESGGKAVATVPSVQKMVLGNDGSVKADQVTIQGDALTILLDGPAGANAFRGTLVKEGPDAGKVLGTFKFRGETHPARLERTESPKVAEMKQNANPLIQEFIAAAQDRDPKSKVQKLRDSLKKHVGSPTNYLFYGELLGTASAAGLGAEEVTGITSAWLKDSALYGEAWVNEARHKALKALGTSKSYAGLTVELAEQADKALDEGASLEQKAAVVGILARAAKLAGKADLATEAEARAAKLESQLDEEYHKKVPPFQPEGYKGRKDPKADRVVMVELFTGAQCPPCVAADVAFDALLKAYKPTELIGLQYHLHIPGPDPLTNKDTEARQQFYGDEIGGTPSTFFNGHSQAGGGGPMQGSAQKFQEYRSIIDSQLESTREAQVQLSANRQGDQIEITAQATVTRKPESTEAKDGKTESKKSGDAKDGSFKPRLRLALTEESIRYVGSNKLRYHHHVVRDFPGGLEGKDLSSGSGQLTVKLNLADLRRDIEEYLSSAAKIRPFPNALPEVPLKELSVVAFVQDDASKSILHAVSLPVK